MTTKVINRTKLPMEYLRDLLAATKPERVTRMVVTFGNTEHSNIHGNGGNQVTIYVPLEWQKPGFDLHQHWRTKYKDKDGYIGVVCYTPEEQFIQVLAHEWRHCWQLVVPRGWRYHGARKSGFSERDADCYGLHVLRQYRRGELSVKPWR